MEPMICLSITNQGLKEQDIIEEVHEYVRAQVDIVEWRIDAYEYRTNWDKVTQTLKTIDKQLGKIPLLLTFRDVLEGGKMEWTKELWQEYLVFLEANVERFDYLDMEMCNFIKMTEKEKTRFRSFFHENQICLIGSYHNFIEMEEEEVIVNRFLKFFDQGMDIIKMAYPAKDTKEVQCLMRAARSCHEIAKTNQVFIPMGNAGRVVRIKPELTYSSIAYCTMKKPSPLGQVTVEEYKKNRMG